MPAPTNHTVGIPEARAVKPRTTRPSEPPSMAHIDHTERLVARRADETRGSFVHAWRTGWVTPWAVDCRARPVTAGEKVPAPAAKATPAARHSVAPARTTSRPSRPRSRGMRALPARAA